MKKIVFGLLILVAVGCTDESSGLIDPDGNRGNGTPGSNDTGWADTDGDGVVDKYDNCPAVSNSDQLDTDGDVVGDACDNCEFVANVNQIDTDSNGLGDACENGAADTDGDGIVDPVDNCPTIANADQADDDLDGVGNACDYCPTSNPSQSDQDGDGVGNACDDDYVGEICASQTFTPSVDTTAPKLKIILDASGSMADELEPNRPRPWPIEQATDAINIVASSLEGKARIGLTQYPFQNAPGSTCTTRTHIALGDNSAAAIANAVTNLQAVGNTPTGFALNAVLDDNLLVDNADPLDANRPEAVILITDGDPTVACASGSPDNRRVVAQPEAVAAAQRLSNAGIPVYVVGFRSGANPENLNEIAAAGGTNAPGGDRFYAANDTQQLADTIEAITVRSVSCSYQLDAVPTNMDKMFVSVNGNAVQESATNGFSFDAASQIVTLNGAECDQIKNAADPTTFQIQVDISCLEDAECTPEPEVCDNIDNNCNGVADEVGCDGECGNEVCDGIDNDCDDEIDDGCPTCKGLGNTCSVDADCCAGSCNAGVCRGECRPTNVACTDSADCCGGVCTGSVLSPGVCTPL